MKMREEKSSKEEQRHAAAAQEKELQLKEEGLEAVRSLCTTGDDSHQDCVVKTLRKIGLLTLLRDAWKWQEASLCMEFVRNWNHQTKVTRVRGIEINVNFETFAHATGLQVEGGVAENVAKARPLDHETLVQHFDFAPATRPQNGYMLERCKDPILRDIVILLNMTLWMKLIRQARCSGELLYLVVHAMEGLEVNWGRVFYEKFVCEVMRLQDVLVNNHIGLHQHLITVAGPLMCFLYDYAKDKPRPDARDFVEVEKENGSSTDLEQNQRLEFKDSICTKRSYQDCVLQEDSGLSGASALPAEMPTKVQKLECIRASMELLDANQPS